MRSEHLGRAMSVLAADRGGERVKQLAGQLRAMGLVRALEFLSVKRGAGRALASAFAEQLGLGADLTAAVQCLEELPREDRLRVEREAYQLAEAVHLVARTGDGGPGWAPPAPLAARDASRTPLTRAQTRIGHVGLAATRLLPVSERGEGRSEALHALLAEASAPRGYELAFARWRELTPPGAERRTALVKATGWVLCGLGNPSPTENGLALHPTWGVPWIPGTSLKGIARAWMVAAGAPPRDIEAWFGRDPRREEADGGHAGAVDFLDAWWVPANEPPWVADIVTPHHKAYYESKETVSPPSGEEEPGPSTFLGARGAYRLVIEGPEAWVGPALDLLLRALSERGVGAKTRAGYGRMERQPDDPFDVRAVERVQEQQRAERDAAARRAATEARRARREGLSPEARIADVTRDEGVAPLRAWLLGGGAPSIEGLPTDEVHVRAAVAALFAANEARGLGDAPEPFGSWAKSALDGIRTQGTTARPVPAETRPLDLAELEALIARHTGGTTVDFNAIARTVLRWPLSGEDRERAASELEARGAKPGHVRDLRKR